MQLTIGHCMPDIVPSLRPQPFNYFDHARQVTRAFTSPCERIHVLHEKRARSNA
jgi:hypothetical protein